MRIVLFASEEGESPLGVPHDRWLLVHLHLAVLGWLTLLILTVGRTLAPMLALAPAAPTRRVPLSELGLTGGLWLLLAGLAADIAPLAAAGATVIALVLAIFGHLLVRIAGTRRMELEAPLAHMLAGIAFLLQATLLGFLLLGGVNVARGTVAYVILLLVGWAAGVTVGYSGKLLSLSAWVWWPPGPRPKQAALYPRRWWQLEVVAFAIGVEVVAVGVLLGSAPTTRAGAAVLCFSAVLALCGVVREIRVRSWLLAQSAR